MEKILSILSQLLGWSFNVLGIFPNAVIVIVAMHIEQCASEHVSNQILDFHDKVEQGVYQRNGEFSVSAHFNFIVSNYKLIDKFIL